MIKAVKTLAAIDAALASDQGAKFRGILRKLMPTAEDAYSERQEDFRTHLGASLIGRECAREIWYGFRWVTLNHHEGRMIRLFNRGHLEEPRMVALLIMIGCEVWQFDSDGRQFRIGDHSGHFGGSLDGVATGIPDLPEGTPALTEFKTHGEKSFLKLVKEGVQKAKWEHFVQMQIYMGKNDLSFGLYCATSKNTDELHLEIVGFSKIHYKRYLDRAGYIIGCKTPPQRINESPGWFGCRFCDHKAICHGKEKAEITCRSCIYSEPAPDKIWYCNLKNKPLTSAEQRIACPSYESIDLRKK